jgi:predicted nucleic acid-binding protein
MKILLDTNIIIHREARNIVREDIGVLFRWIDQLHYEKWVHPSSIAEIEKHADPDVVRTLKIKIGNYSVLKTIAPVTPDLAAIRATDRTPNDHIDTSLVAELVAGRVDIIITEDRGIHRKAALLRIIDKVFTIDAFLEKVTAENPELADYRVLSVRKMYFGEITLGDPFFDSFREDYPGFDKWFNKKANEIAYVCISEANEIVAFLYLKREGPAENYTDITPSLLPASRLKIGTFKVISNGFKLGERFLKIVFDNAILLDSQEIYVTIFDHRAEQVRLMELLQDWGFAYHGVKRSAGGNEQVFVRDFRPQINLADPRKSYPFIAASARKFIVAIYPEYHTELLPDSILRTESPEDYEDNRPNRNAISKVYVSRSLERNLRRGDVLVFYRTKSNGSAYHTSVATTIGIVQNVVRGIQNLDDFLRACRKRSVFTDAELAEHWNYKPHDRPFVVNFLYVYSLPKRPNLKALLDAGVITQAPRGFEPLEEAAFDKLLEISNADKRIVVS